MYTVIGRKNYTIAPENPGVSCRNLFFKEGIIARWVKEMDFSIFVFFSMIS